MKKIINISKIKRFVSINLILSIIFSLVLCTPVMASETVDYESYSKISNISVDDLKKINEIYGRDFLEAAINEYLEKDAIMIQPFSLEDPNLPVERISIAQYWSAISRGMKGQIWITKDGNWELINHGHAGLLYGYATYYVAFIEHGGYDYVGKNLYGDILPKGYSGVTEWDNFEGTNANDAPWMKVHTLRTYNVTTPTSDSQGLPYDFTTMICAADYASFNLLGRSYNPLANKEYYNQLNCATLVYRAYKNANVYGGNSIALGNPDSPTVIPKDLVEDTRLVLAYSAQWGGNSHVWNE